MIHQNTHDKHMPQAPKPLIIKKKLKIGIPKDSTEAISKATLSRTPTLDKKIKLKNSVTVDPANIHNTPKVELKKFKIKKEMKTITPPNE